jgi:hypothetical protein
MDMRNFICGKQGAILPAGDLISGSRLHSQPDFAVNYPTLSHARHIPGAAFTSSAIGAWRENGPDQFLCGFLSNIKPQLKQTCLSCIVLTFSLPALTFP